MVQAVLAAAHPAAAGQSYFVTDGQPCSGQELYALIRRALGRSVPRAGRYRPGCCIAAAGLTDGALWLAGRRERPFAAMLDKLLWLGLLRFHAHRARTGLPTCGRWRGIWKQRCWMWRDGGIERMETGVLRIWRQPLGHLVLATLGGALLTGLLLLLFYIGGGLTRWRRPWS